MSSEREKRTYTDEEKEAYLKRQKKTYSISEAAEFAGLSVDTLRYYDKEGLLPFLHRTSSGVRRFTSTDFEWLLVVDCLKKTGLSIQEIRQYAELCLQGDSTLGTRHELFLARREALLAQMRKMEEALYRVDFKCWYYQTALDAGTESVLLKGDNPLKSCFLAYGQYRDSLTETKEQS